MMEVVDPADIRAFVNRNWRLVEQSKVEHWAEWKKGKTADEILQIAADLRNHIARIKPDWPTDRERAADIAEHARFSELLSRAAPHFAR